MVFSYYYDNVAVNVTGIATDTAFTQLLLTIELTICGIPVVGTTDAICPAVPVNEIGLNKILKGTCTSWLHPTGT